MAPGWSRWLVVAVWLAGSTIRAQDSPAAYPPETPDTAVSRPLPDIATLMREVEAHQRQSEAIKKDYLYHEVVTADETDHHGGVKKSTTSEYDIFWLNGVEVSRLVKKDGKALTDSEQKKEDERIDKEVAKAKERRAKADAEGKSTDSHGVELVTVSRLLALGSYSNPRRVSLHGRDAIAVDYVGDPQAKTRNPTEEVIRDLAGTVWIDEQDRTVARSEGRFLNDFKVGGGVVMSIKKGTNFRFEQKKVNGEVWLPVLVEGEGSMRALLLIGFNGRIRAETSDYRKFKASATVLPGMSTVEQTPASTQPTDPY